MSPSMCYNPSDYYLNAVQDDYTSIIFILFFYKQTRSDFSLNRWRWKSIVIFSCLLVRKSKGRLRCWIGGKRLLSQWVALTEHNRRKQWVLDFNHLRNWVLYNFYCECNYNYKAKYQRILIQSWEVLCLTVCLGFQKSKLSSMFSHRSIRQGTCLWQKKYHPVIQTGTIKTGSNRKNWQTKSRCHTCGPSCPSESHMVRAE